MRDVSGAIHTAGAVTVVPGQPARRLLATADDRIIVDVSLDGGAELPAPRLTLVSGGGPPLSAVLAASGTIEPASVRLEAGANTLEFALDDGLGHLSLLATTERAAPRVLITLLVTAEAEGANVLVLGQLLVRADD